jgi:hypothetical protein
VVPVDLSVSSLFNVKGKVGEYNLMVQQPEIRALSVPAAVVTGGGSGIGTMIATALVQNGAKVYIASRKESQLKEVAHFQVVLPDITLSLFMLVV